MLGDLEMGQTCTMLSHGISMKIVDRIFEKGDIKKKAIVLDMSFRLVAKSVRLSLYE